MPQAAAASYLNNILYRLRIPAAAAALLFILYCSIYLWFYVPYEDFTAVWRPDSRLVVASVPEESLAAPYLQAGDKVVAVGGQPLLRMRPIYPLPLQTYYDYTIHRDGAESIVSIPFSRQVTPLALHLRLPPVVLALLGWLVGAVLLLFAKRDSLQAIHVGYIFLFSAVVGASIQAALYGVPGAWVSGHVLIFFLLPSWVYLGFIPRNDSLPRPVRVLLAMLSALSGLLAVAAAYEYLYLFTRLSSVSEIVGVSLYSLGLLLSGLGLLACVLILTWRVLTMPQASYLRRQLLILLLFIGTGTLPAVLLTIVPRALFDVTPLPFPIAIALMSLIPAGYMFVIYRRGFLGLDLLFSRVIYFVLLWMFGFGFFTTGLYLVQRVLRVGDGEFIVPAAAVFFPSLLLTVYVNRPLSQFVDEVVYGKAALNQEALESFLRALSAKPEFSTLNQIVKSLADMLDISRAVLLLKDEDGLFKPTASSGLDDESLTLTEVPRLTRTIVRYVDRKRFETVDEMFLWAEMLLPITVRGEQIGILALSQPGTDGYFNAQQVSFLEQAAQVLAVGSENLFLFESVRRMARQVLVLREQEQKRVSMQLHDEPLHQITYATVLLDHALTKHFNDHPIQDSYDSDALASKLTTATEHLREAAAALRKICTDLHLPFQEQGLKMALEEVLDHFVQAYDMNCCFELEVPEQVATHVPAKTVQAISRVLNGALLNVVKHAPHSGVHVTVSNDDDSLLLSVADDGPGSHAANLSYTELVRGGHLGFIGMYEWAQSANGQLQVLANEPTGLEVLLRCPLYTPLLPRE